MSRVLKRRTQKSGEAAKKMRLQLLRDRAEQSIRESGSLRRMRKGSMLELLHEMNVYQAELEIQNEELRRSQLALQESQRGYAALYDFAPVGYLTFDRQGVIEKVNLAGAQLLGVARRHLIHTGFHRFVAKESQQTFHRFCARVFQADGRESCELRLKPKAGPPVDIHMAGSAIVQAADRSTLCQAAIIDVTARKEAEERLESSRQELQALAARLQMAHEAERSLLAREIHDELSGTLTALKMDLSLLPDRAAKDRKLFFQKLSSMTELIDHSVARMHAIVTELRPVVLDKLGLVAAIEWQAGEFQDRWGIACETHLPAGKFVLDSDRSTALFRILQEALTNVVRHAHGTKVVVDLRNQGENVILTVRDNGKGINPKALHAHESIGLLGMRERALSFGGKTEVARSPEGGTCVTARIPTG
jgi:PAS domain S-box-containing protein